MHTLTNVKVSRDKERWEVEIKADIPAESLTRYRAEALKEIQKTAKLDGFRPGKAPESRIVEVYGEDAIMRHAAEHAIEHELPEFFAAEKLPIVGAPKVTVDPPKSGQVLSVTARAPLAPEITLPDYRAVAKGHANDDTKVEVTDDEQAQTMLHLRRERARIEKIESGVEHQKAAEESRAMKEEELPALDDAFTQSLGYENTNAFTKKLRENLQTEKDIQQKEKKRAAIIDDLVKGASISYPAMLLEYELDDMEARMKSDLERAGTNFEQYLAQIKKSSDEVRKEWRPVGDKRAKVRLILGEIARKENIEADEKRVEAELNHAKKHYSDADPNALRAHISHALKNEAVLNFLEAVK